MNCPHCGRQVDTRNTTFCLYCGKPLYLKNSINVRKYFPKIAGIVTIAGSVSSIISSISYLWLSSLFWTNINNSFMFFYAMIYLYIPAVIGMLSFVLGLIGSLFAFRKPRKRLLIIGNSLIVVSGILFFSYFGNQLTIFFNWAGILPAHAGMIVSTLRPLGVLAFLMLGSGILSIILTMLFKSVDRPIPPPPPT